MKYNFDEIVDRNQNRSAKYDERIKKFGTNDVIPLWIADMDFKTAPPIINAMISKAEEGIWGYTSRPDSYFQSICDWQLRRNSRKLDKNLLSWSLGVVPALSSIVNLFSCKEDNILIQTPVYSEFYDVGESWNRKVLENKLIEKNGNWSIDFEDFEKKAKISKIFILCNPHNPLGIVWTKEELTKLTDICIKHSVLIVSDEIHSDLIFHNKKFIPTASLSEEVNQNTITCISATKTFNLAGLQASTTIFPNLEMKNQFDKFWLKLEIHRNNSFSSNAMEVAFNEGEEWLEELLHYISDNFNFIKEYCNKYIPKIKPNIPDATYLVWLDCRDLNLSNEKLHNFMIKEAKLGLNDGYTFSRSLSGYMRLNAACPRKTLEKALSQLKAAVDNLNK